MIENIGQQAIDTPQEHETPYFLMREVLRILKEGGAQEAERRFRDLYWGVGSTTAVGLLGLVATFGPQFEISFELTLVVLLAASTLASLALAVYHHKRTQGHPKFTGDSHRVAQAIESYLEPSFGETVTGDGSRPLFAEVASTAPDSKLDRRLAELENAGLLKRPQRSLDAAFWKLPRGRDDTSSLRAKLTMEREASW